MEKIYRLRPMNENTIDELTNHYLWFSKPCAFRDVKDANVRALIENNSIVIRALSQVYSEERIEELKVKMQDIGICCFTESIPNRREHVRFPQGHNSICVEYDKTLLEEYFSERSPYRMPHVFNNVIYSDNAVINQDDTGFFYLNLVGEGFQRYCNIRELIQHPREIDKFFLTILSTIDSFYSHQKEQRIILGGINIQGFDGNELGYRIEIPQEAICAVHVYNEDDRAFLGNLDEVLPISVVD